MNFPLNGFETWRRNDDEMCAGFVTSMIVSMECMKDITGEKGHEFES